MSLTEVRTGSAARALEKHVKEAERGSQLLVLCATAAQEQDLGRVHASWDGTSHVLASRKNLPVMSIAAFVRQLWTRWGDNRELASSAVRNEVATHIVEAQSEIPSLKTAGGKSLFLRLAQAYPYDTKPPVDDPSLLQKDPLRRLLNHYCAQLKERGCIEHQFAMRILAEGIKDGAVQLDFTKLVLCGFSDLSLAQDALIQAISEDLEVCEIAEVEELNLSADLILGQAQGRAAEIELMADFAYSIRDRNPFCSKALLVPRLHDYLHPLTRALETRGVPFEIDVKLPLGSTLFGAALIALLRLATDKDAQQAAISFALSAYSGLNPDEALALETKWRRYRKSAARMLTELVQHPSGACRELRMIRSSDQSAHIADWYVLISSLYSGGQNISGRGQFEQLQDAAAQKTAVTALQEIYENLYAEHVESGLAALDHVQPGSKILGFDPRISASALLQLLEDAVVSQTPAPGSPHILIAQPQRARGRSFDEVILGGLSSADERQPVDNPLDLRISSRMSGQALPDVAAQQRAEIYSLLNLAKSKLYLVAVSETIGGEELEPGLLLKTLRQEMGEEFDQIESVQRSNDETLSQLGGSEGDKKKLILDVLGHRETLRPRTVGGYGRTRHHDLGFSEGKAVSATGLQNYATCPYNWFLKRYVDGRDVDRSFNAMAQGSFAHLVLKNFYERLPKEGLGRRVTHDKLLEARVLLSTVFDETLVEYERELPLLPEEMPDVKRIREALAAFLEREIEFAPQFEPQYLEHEFDNIDIGLGLPLRGIIDRVDVRAGDKAAIIIDYKRSLKNMGKLDSQVTHKVYQGLLYSLAARRALGVRPVAYSYRAYEGGSPDTISVYAQEDNPEKKPLGLPKEGRGKIWGYPEAKIEECFAEMKASARTAAADLKAGRVEIRENKKICTYCPYDDCPHKTTWVGGR
ncbi:MAG: PD-(D/E)XK nuclease family protein [Coriobacteriia bacterium]|nr:PD-(D/E)XK nuclease family protein [Coriobacteriia bacterium]MCL2537133.1 PD-(D/E)XK nuclease family protein [Coriobacteriia bacterium]